MNFWLAKKKINIVNLKEQHWDIFVYIFEQSVLREKEERSSCIFFKALFYF